jgi:1-aminocyclopropane-1-carboxylate deaminase/D-cysteine desulfhydrase-like pyridoxal-dependent ACC family enzyme
MRSEPFYVKREDELGFGVSGSKLRKYVSILPALKKAGKKVALIGSFHSNHVLSMLQLLKQEGLPYQLFLQRPVSSEKEGNAFFLSLLIQENEVIWLEKVPDVLQEEWKKTYEEKLGEEFFWIPIGGCMKEALIGSLTLPLDILQNEEELNICFDHVCVDAGTGMSAIGLILGMSYLQKSPQVHVVLMAGKESEFEEKLSFFHQELQTLLQESFPLITYRCVLPITAKSFGSHNASIFQIIKKTAEKEGFFLDPLYTAKLLLTVKEVQLQENLKGDILWVHSGGALSLSGFQNAKFV